MTKGITVFKIFILGGIVGYTVGNLVLRRRASGAVKRDLRTYTRRYTSPNEILNMVIPIPMLFLQFYLKFEHGKPHKAAYHPTNYDVIKYVKLFQTTRISQNKLS